MHTLSYAYTCMHSIECHMYTCTYAYSHTYRHTCSCMCTCLYTHINTDTQAYTHTHCNKSMMLLKEEVVQTSPKRSYGF